MVRRYLNIDEIPAILWGEESDNVYIYVHGKFGSKEDAGRFAEIVCKKGWQVLSFDLPEHGDRKIEKDCFDPWHVVPEMKEIMRFVKSSWVKVSLMGNSIGAWFAMLSFVEIKFDQCLFVCPILDMERLIINMMEDASVSLKELKDKKKIVTESGEVLSWKYLMYSKDYAIERWSSPTHIFYAEEDELTSRDTVDLFVDKFNCQLEVLKNSKHWIHTKEQVAVLEEWLDKKTD
ncbi:MAG: alpha/beta hydrolase [Clostridiales bacterium]|nr:alpha/beta hydrolase [Clostridiales bacterium]